MFEAIPTPGVPPLPSRRQATSAHPGRILIVDDDPPARRALCPALVSFGHEVREAETGTQAVRMLDNAVDLMVLDLDMPGLNGLQAARHVRIAAGSEVPIIMVTARTGGDARMEAVLSGVNDFIEKPCLVRDLQLRVEAQLRMRRALRRAMAPEPAGLGSGGGDRDLGGVLEQLEEARRQTHEAHLTRMSTYSTLVAASLELDSETCERIRLASPMHDIGKIGVPDAVLSKPGPLDPDERAAMERHTVIGARILGTSEAPLIRTAREIALAHHERWDGSGYPHGQVGDQIPLAARICAVADFFDALTSDRPYRRAEPNEEVFDMMRKESGRHFDPSVLEAFFAAREAVEEAQRAGAAWAGLAWNPAKQPTPLG